ncbi:hypothetical protein WJX74_007487 [Apatococcus lobatus]|uniref:Acetyl-coenzyme A synthetase n=1 Tax=Apatococcus lobatus TaxID=904363 RepID=A0AAW1RSM7_9CHLO
MERVRVLAGHLTADCLDINEPSISRISTNAASSQGNTVDARYHARTGINSRGDYEKMYKRSIQDPAGFWQEQAQAFTWQRKWEQKHMDFNFDRWKGEIGIEFFKGGTTNMSYNCLDRNVKEGRGSQICFLWEGNDVGTDRRMTYQQVLDETCRVANWLKQEGVRKGDCVAIYMPLVCELPIAMLACARIGALHSVVFGGFSAEALASRIEGCRSKVLVTATGGARGKKPIELKKIADAAMDISKKNGFQVKSVLLYEHPAMPKSKVSSQQGRDVWYHEVIPKQSSSCAVEWLDAEAPLFLLYTSGSTGKPKGVVHTTGGYMVMAAVSTKYVFDLQPGDVYWCTADCGWITGHTYLTYGPLLNGATSVVYEGVPTHPDPSRIWQIVEKYKVRQLYTAPTLIRTLESHGDEFVTRHNRSSLKILGTVGEPINPRAWEWFYKVGGEGRCPIVDTWWQTETGGILITPLPGAWALKPGSATLPFFGVHPVLVDDKGREIDGSGEGILCMKTAWPSTIRTIYGDHKRMEETYFSTFNGYYFTGDGSRRDDQGFYWITGRVDDVINVSGHRVGTAEVESALQSHEQVIEAAVVGYDHNIKGQGIYAYVGLHEGVERSAQLKKELKALVRREIGAFAAPDVLHWAPGLPKTRSGKIMRRVLRKIATKEESQLGDTSTLADPSVVDKLLETRGQ